MARSDPQVNIRMPLELKSALEEAAKASGRSLNAEIVARLQSGVTSKQDDQLVNALAGQVSAYKALLRRAAGAIQMALIRGKERKIPEEDARWLQDEYKELSKLGAEERP